MEALKKHEKQELLEKRLRELEREHKDTEQVVSEMVNRRKQVEVEIKQLKSQINQLKPKEVGVSDHALLRYMERHYEINVEQYRKEILDLVAGCKDMGEVQVNGFVVKNNSVVTYVPSTHWTVFKG